MSNHKKRKFKNRVEQGNRIKSPDTTPISDENKTPVFSFLYSDYQSKYAYVSCTGKELFSLIRTLNNLSKHTWIQLKNASYKKVGYEKIQHGFEGELPAGLTGKKIIAFRFHQQKPMLGVRDGRVFYIIWLDPKMKLYKH